MSDEGEAGESVVAFCEEERSYHDMRRRFEEAGRDLDEARKLLNDWKAVHGDDNDRCRELERRVIDSNIMLNDANTRLNDAERRWANTRAAAPIYVTDILKRMNISYSTRDVNYLMDKEFAKYTHLKHPSVTKNEVIRIMAAVKSAINSVTRNAIGAHHGFLLDGPLNLQGQSKSSLYFAFSNNSRVLAAKVYEANFKDSFDREVTMSQLLGNHHNIVKFVASFSIPQTSNTATDNRARHIIVMPFFPRSSADLLIQHSTVPLLTIMIIARDCIAALCHIHSKGYCFGDVKPSNIMLSNCENGGATLVDFGATVKIGQPIVEITAQYCLDVNVSEGSEEIDWTCFGVTLSQLAGVNVSNLRKTVEHVRRVQEFNMSDRLKQLIIATMEGPTQKKVQSALDSFLHSCRVCYRDFDIFHREHHCRLCGLGVCGDHSRNKLKLVTFDEPVRVCDDCFNRSEHE